MSDSTKIINDILEVINYSGNREQHAEELTALLNDTIKLKVFEETQRFFEEYLKSIDPTINSEQREALTKYIQNLQKE